MGKLAELTGGGAGILECQIRESLLTTGNTPWHKRIAQHHAVPEVEDRP